MKLYIVAIRDAKVGGYRPPMFVPNIGACLRAIGDYVNTKDDNDIYKHPEDFEVFHLGTFDDETAVFDVLAAPVSLQHCSSMVRDGQVSQLKKVN